MDIPKGLLLDQFMWGDKITTYPITTSTFSDGIHHAPFFIKSKAPPVTQPAEREQTRFQE